MFAFFWYIAFVSYEQISVGMYMGSEKRNLHIFCKMLMLTAINHYSHFTIFIRLSCNCAVIEHVAEESEEIKTYLISISYMLNYIKYFMYTI